MLPVLLCKFVQLVFIVPDKSGILEIFFFFLHKNICCGYSLESAH